MDSELRRSHDEFAARVKRERGIAAKYPESRRAIAEQGRRQARVLNRPLNERIAIERSPKTPHQKQLRAQREAGMPRSVQKAADARQGLWAQGGPEAQAEGLSWLVEESSLADDMRLWRGAKLAHAVGVGDVIEPHSDQPISTSTDPLIGRAFAADIGLGEGDEYLLDIHAPAGLRGGALPKGKAGGTELEVVLAPDTRFRVEDVQLFSYADDNYMADGAPKIVRVLRVVAI